MTKELIHSQDQVDEILDYYDSPFLTFGNDIPAAGDPETAEEFVTALRVCPEIR